PFQPPARLLRQQSVAQGRIHGEREMGRLLLRRPLGDASRTDVTTEPEPAGRLDGHIQPRATAAGQFLDEPLWWSHQLQLFAQVTHVGLRTTELGGATVKPQLPAALHLPPVQRSVRDLQPNDRAGSGTPVASIAIQVDLLPAEMNQQLLKRGYPDETDNLFLRRNTSAHRCARAGSNQNNRL